MHQIDGGWARCASRAHIPTSTALLRLDRDFYGRAAILERGLRFRTRIVLVLAVIGLLPLLVLGWLSSSLNRDELERTVGGAHQATAVAAARACERWLGQSLEALQLSLAAISLDRLTPEEASTVLRIPYRQPRWCASCAVATARSWLAAFAPLGDLGWGVVVAQPASSAGRSRIMSHFCATERAERRPGAIERSGPCRAAV